MSATKSPTKAAVIEKGLRELIARRARKRLAALYGLRSCSHGTKATANHVQCSLGKSP